MNIFLEKFIIVLPTERNKAYFHQVKSHAISAKSWSIIYYDHCVGGRVF